MGTKEVLNAVGNTVVNTATVFDRIADSALKSAQGLVSKTIEPYFFSDAQIILKCIQPTQGDTLSGLDEFYGISPRYSIIAIADNFAVTSFFARIIQRYYPKNVVERHGENKIVSSNRIQRNIDDNRFMNDPVSLLVKRIHIYDIIGTHFLIPYAKDCMMVIEITNKGDNNATDTNLNSVLLSTTKFKVSFIGTGHIRAKTKLMGHLRNTIINVTNKFKDLEKELESEYESIRYIDISSMEDLQCPISHPKSTNRPFDTVYLNDYKDKYIVDKIDKFFSDSCKEMYKEINENYRFNILLYGDPGTGKNSMCDMLATRFGLPIYRLSPQLFLSNNGITKSDADAPNAAVLVQLVSLIEEHCIILIDEIDVYFSSRDTLNDNTHTNPAAFVNLLYMLDNVGNGKIVICTTNHFERLDPALVRDGRFDLRMNIRNWTEDTLERALSHHRVTRDALEAVNLKHNGVARLEADNADDTYKYRPATIMNLIRLHKLDTVWNEVME